MEPRYDAVAQWYAEFTGEWSPVCLPYLPDDLHSQRVLDLACGAGTLSELIAGRGAVVTAVDVSAGMLARARPTDGVDYRLGDAESTSWWDGEPFDGVVSNMALMDIGDLDAALATMVVVTRPGGWILASLLHPCFPGREETRTKSSWPPDRGYGCEGWWTTGSDGMRGHVGAHHRTLSTYLNAMINVGLELTEVVEPPADRPLFLVVRCRTRPR